MKEDVQNFLKSGLLDKYVIGDTSASENIEIENYINEFLEVQEEYEILQAHLELAAKTNSKKAPARILGSVLEAIDDNKPVIHIHHKRTPWYSIAASIAALVFAGTSFLFYSKSLKLLDENNTIAEEIFDLRDDIKNNNNRLDDVMIEFQKLNNPETEKYVLRGNERARELKTVAYINPIEKSTLIDIVSLPKLSDEQCYQMWAQLQDKMVNLGVLTEADRKLKPIPYIKDALALNITIEPKGGNKDASLENSVAEIPINN